MATDNIIPVDLSQKCDNSAAESQQNSVESLGYHSGKDELTELLCDEDISQVSPPKQVREPLEDDTTKDPVRAVKDSRLLGTFNSFHQKFVQQILNFSFTVFQVTQEYLTIC